MSGSGPVVDLPLLSRFTDGAGNMVTSNRGSLLGTCQCGDGVTPATFPTLLGGGRRGMSFNGSQYLQWLAALANGTYSFVCTGKVSWTVFAGFLFDARAGGGTGFLWTNGSGVLASGGSGTIYVDGEPSTALPTGKIATIAVSGIALSAPSFLALLNNNTLAAPWIGDVYSWRLYPGTLTPTQIRAIGDRDRAMINLF